MQLAETHEPAATQQSRNQQSQPAPHSKRPVPKTFALSRSASALGVFALVFASGCGNNYRPVVTAISPVGPAGQPQKFAVVTSDPNPKDPTTGLRTGGLPGILTFADFSGDTVLITASIGVDPQYLILNNGGSTAYTLNGDGTVNAAPVSTLLIASQVTQTTLLSNPAPNATSLFPQGTYTYITQPGRSSVAEFTGSSPLTLQQELASVGPAPIYIAGVASAPRIYVLSPSATPGAPGTATPIEVSTNTPSGSLPVGVNPVYGVMTADARRAFVLNHGSNTVSVINAQNNQLDAGVPNGIIADPSAVAPIWADFAPTLSELLVLNEGNGTGNGSVSIFSIPLCSAAAQPTNPNCDVNNPIDAAGFGNLVANIPVGKNPLMIAALQDGSQAYVINQADSTVSVINLTTNTVTATVPVPATLNPTFVAATTGTPTGKVYVISSGINLSPGVTPTSGSKTMTVIRTDTNQVDTTIPLQGYGIQVRVTAP